MRAFSTRNVIASGVVAAGLLTIGVSSALAASKTNGVMAGEPQAVASALIEEMIDRQYVLTERTGTSLQFERPIDNAALYPQLGGNPGNLPRARVTMTLVPAGHRTKVSADLVIVRNPGASNEIVADAKLDARLDSVLTGARQTLIASAQREPDHVAMADPSRR